MADVLDFDKLLNARMLGSAHIELKENDWRARKPSRPTGNPSLTGCPRPSEPNPRILKWRHG